MKKCKKCWYKIYCDNNKYYPNFKPCEIVLSENPLNIHILRSVNDITEDLHLQYDDLLED